MDDSIGILVFIAPLAALVHSSIGCLVHKEYTNFSVLFLCICHPFLSPIGDTNLLKKENKESLNLQAFKA
jgi:hypothetical protein